MDKNNNNIELPIAKRKPKREIKQPVHVYVPDPETKFIDDNDDEDEGDLSDVSDNEEMDIDSEDEESFEGDYTKHGYGKDGFVVDSDEEIEYDDDDGSYIDEEEETAYSTSDYETEDEDITEDAEEEEEEEVDD